MRPPGSASGCTGRKKERGSTRRDTPALREPNQAGDNDFPVRTENAAYAKRVLDTDLGTVRSSC